jgi:predicted ferric reductase
LWLDYRADPARSLLAIFSANLVMLLPASWQGLMTSEAQIMGLPLTGQTQAYWYMARAGGLVAYLLLWLSVIWGLTLSTKITDRLVPPLLAYGLHEFLSIGAVLFTVWHGLVLLGDHYIHFTLFHLIIPFIAPYEPVWTGLGIIGFYLSAILTGSFYVRKHIGQRMWRALHYLTFGVYGLALVHGWMAGSDSELTLLKLMYLLTGGSVLYLTYYRLFTLRTKESKLVRG